MTEDREKFLERLLHNAEALSLLHDNISSANYQLAENIEFEFYKEIEFYCKRFELVFKSLYLFAHIAEKDMFEKTVDQLENILIDLPANLTNVKKIFEEQSKLAKENTH